jgi:mRNA-degrading endonuclease RelE of RelBE toxin-antitoxin system
MKSRINDDFLDAYRKLPKEVREQARKAYRLFRDNPHHPSLNFKRIHPNQPIYSARVSRGYRTLGVRSDDVMIWFWIGSHADYDKLLSTL